MTIEVVALSGSEFSAAIPELARLRIRIFREWPYLYDGDLVYEERYLRRFVEADRAFLAVARDGEAVVGAATAAPICIDGVHFPVDRKTRMNPCRAVAN